MNLKTIGLLGGMSWESTATYYKLINQKINSKLGGLHSAKIILNSVDFAEIETLQQTNNWSEAAYMLSQESINIEKAGADFILICTNTMHKVFDEIECSVVIPVLHIADATATKLIKDGITKVGLIGTSFTMLEDFYKGRLQNKFNIEVVVPKQQSQQEIHRIIYQELCLGKIHKASREKYLNIINQLSDSGAQAIILGCTEIAMLIQQKHTHVKLYDTTEIHCQEAVNLALTGI
jgi:aspartate racemase